MRVVQVIHGFLPQFRGGTELYLLGLCRELRRLGHEVHIITGTTDNASESHIEDYWFDEFPVKKIVLSGSYLEHWTRSFSPEAARLFAESIAEIKPDIVHVQHWYRLSRSLIETCHRMSIPAVCTLHDLWTTCPRIFRIRDESFCTSPLSGEGCASCVPRFPWMEEAETASAVELFKADFANEMALAHRIIVPSKAHGEVISNVVDLPREKVQVIPHGTILELQEDRPTRPPTRRIIGRRSRIFAEKHPIRLGMWAHLFHMKGAHLVLEALQSLRDKGRFEFHVWGEVTEPQYKQRLMAAADGVQVHWHGAFVPEDLRKVDLDLAVIPSLCSESFSFVLDEAFDLNLPAIVPKRGALEERIGSAGTTFLPENSKDLSRVLKIILKKPELIDTWRQAIPEVTSMGWHGREIQFIYQDVLSKVDRVDLRSNPGLPWRRLEFQTAWNRRQEVMMFGYLGHIKRESGRGDHFEREMRQLMSEKDEWGTSLAEKTSALTELENQLKDIKGREETHREMVNNLAAELEAMRAALIAVNHARPMIRTEAPVVDDVKDHIPGMGTISEMVANNQEILDDYGVALRAMSRASLDKVLTLLSEEVIAFRHLLTLGVADAAEFERTLPRIPTSAVDLPGIGRVDDLIRDNSQAMAAHSAASQSFLDQLADHEKAQEELGRTHEAALEAANMEHEKYCKTLLGSLAEKADAIEALAKEIGLFQTSMTLIHDADPETPLIEEKDPKVKVDIPGFGDLGQLVSDNHDLIRDHVTHLKDLKASEANTADVISFLAHEVLSFRSLVARLFDSKRQFERLSPALPDAEFSVPGLGELSEIVEVNSELMKGMTENYAHFQAEIQKREESAEEIGRESEGARLTREEAFSSQVAAYEERLSTDSQELGSLRDGLARQSKLVELLGELIDEMRRGITAIFVEDMLFKPLALDESIQVEDHVPGLGDIGTIQQVNHELVEEVHSEVRTLRQALAQAHSEMSEPETDAESEPGPGGEDTDPHDPQL